MGGLSWQHLLIVLLIVLVLFGGSRLAGLGKSTGRALREFKEETKDLRGKSEDGEQPPTATGQAQVPPNSELPASYTVQQPQNTSNQMPPQNPVPPAQPQPQQEFVNPVQSTDKRDN